MARPITITDAKVIVTQPQRERLIIVKVITSEPGLHGLGCATFTQRAFAVKAALESHLIPFLIGRDVSRIEDIWRMGQVHGYWRNGPVLNNALSGIDQALWDILGKRAGLPVHDLLGGKCREAAAVYTHADGKTPQEVCDHALAIIGDGYRHVRLQLQNYGGGESHLARPDGAAAGAYYDPRSYARRTLAMLEHARKTLGDDVELMHDVHERLPPSEALQFAKDVERFRLYFLEDALPPEHLEWFAHFRQQCSTPLAMGELFNHPLEWKPMIVNRWLDFIRVHISQVGGLSRARDIAVLANLHGVRTAWHGPADTSPVGHAANLHLELATPNFGIHEWSGFSDLTHEMFPGLPQVRRGYLYPNDRPGLGIDINEALAAKYPPTTEVEQWTQARLPDGSPTFP